MSEYSLLLLFVCFMVLADKAGNPTFTPDIMLHRRMEKFLFQSFYKLGFMSKPRHKVKLSQQRAFSLSRVKTVYA